MQFIRKNHVTRFFLFVMTAVNQSGLRRAYPVSVSKKNNLAIPGLTNFASAWLYNEILLTSEN